MRVLAIEQSATIGSCALCRDGELLAECQWDNTTAKGQPLFPALGRLLVKTCIPLSDVDTFVVGLGPGRFSALRVSLSALKGLALPGGRPVYGISSGDLLARDIFEERDTPRVVVVGDARRNRIWYAVFGRKDGRIVQEVPYALIPNDDFPPCLPPDALVVTPEWERLRNTFDELGIPSHCLIGESRYPRAATATVRIQTLMQAGQAEEAVSPIYMHPPVFVEPKFPTRL